MSYQEWSKRKTWFYAGMFLMLFWGCVMVVVFG